MKCAQIYRSECNQRVYHAGRVSTSESRHAAERRLLLPATSLTPALASKNHAPSVSVGENVARASAEVRGLRQKPSCTRRSLRPNTLTTLSVVLMHHSWLVGLNDFSEPWRLQRCYVFVCLRSHMFAFATVSRAKMTPSGALLTLIFD